MKITPARWRVTNAGFCSRSGRALLVSAWIVLLSACGGDTPEAVAVTLQSIQVTPTSPILNTGATEQFTATAIYSDASRRNVTTLSAWSSSVTSVATISDSSPNRGLASAHAAGTTTISAIFESVSGATTLRVTAATLTSLVVAPENPTIVVGAKQNFVATGFFSDSSSGNITNQVEWLSENAGVAQIGNSAGNKGAATAIGIGTSTITARDTATAVFGTTTLTVPDTSACVAPAAPTNLRTNPGPGAAQTTIAWSPASNNGGDPVDRYIVYRDGGQFAHLGNMQAYGDTGVSGNHSYQVSALNSCGRESALSAAIVGSPLPGTLLVAPVTPGPVFESEISAYKVLDASGNQIGTRNWRKVRGLGNQFETYVASDAAGRLLEYGGVRIRISNDEGASWSTVSNVLPDVEGEGAIVGAPGGDILAVNWDLYHGDLLWTHKYVAATGLWYTARIALHQPVYDRPWISVIQGPFEVNGVVVPYVSFVNSNVHRNPRLMSLDGLSYSVPTARNLAQLQAPVNFVVPPDPGRDWIQSLQESRLFPLSNGFGLDGLGISACDTAVLNSAANWNCVNWGAIANPPSNTEVVRVDSAGAVHITNAAIKASELSHRVSLDGGLTWKTVTATIPGQRYIEKWDVQVNAALDQVVVVVHARGTPPKTDQDMVFRFTDIHGAIRLKEILLVGDGDFAFAFDELSSPNRFDFTTGAILASGHVALSFGDAKHRNPPGPGVAIEMGN